MFNCSAASQLKPRFRAIFPGIAHSPVPTGGNSFSTATAVVAARRVVLPFLVVALVVFAFLFERDAAARRPFLAVPVLAPLVAAFVAAAVFFFAVAPFC